jgi:hypothetical protein
MGLQNFKIYVLGLFWGFHVTGHDRAKFQVPSPSRSRLEFVYISELNIGLYSYLERLKKELDIYSRKETK